jgi:hypothetical protein
VLAGAAANAGSLKLAADGNDPFGAADFDENHGRPHRSITALHTIMIDEDLDPRNPGTIPLMAASENGAGLESASARRSHRAQPRRSKRASGRRRRRWPIVTTSLLVLLAIIVGGGYIALSVTQGQYYLTVTNGQIVIYRGISHPTKFLWLNLSHVYHQTGIPLSEVPTNFRPTVTTASVAGSLPQVQTAVHNISAAIGACRSQYQAVQTWTMNENKYQSEVRVALAHHKPTKGFHNPGPQPGVDPMCPSAQALGISSTTQSPTPTPPA